MQVMRLIICRQLDHKTGGLLLYGLQTASNNLRSIDFEHRHKPSIVIDPSSVRENGVGDHAWHPDDFAEEEEEVEGSSVERTCPERMSKEPSPATLSTEVAAADHNEEWKEVERMESALEGAQQGNWRALKTVFELVGIYPPKDGASSGNSFDGG
jgi:hypothetical protein